MENLNVNQVWAETRFKSRLREIENGDQLAKNLNLDCVFQNYVFEILEWLETCLEISILLLMSQKGIAPSVTGAEGKLNWLKL